MIKLLFTITGICLVVTSVCQHPESTLKEYVKTFKTYAFSDPDPIARPGSIYPYYRFDGYTDKPANKSWKVVELENEFIKVMILPEIGGKIWGAWEKSSGRPFIYYNQVVKFRDVAMRGPWTSGGIEANYGIIGHTPNCATPVDYLTEKKSDGSVSCYIGTLDLLTQTYWTIEINLPKDKGYFTTRSFWHNSTPLEQPYYTWMNAGIKAAGNLEFIYPGKRYIGHSGEFADWNINPENGKNISFYEQNNFGEYKSYHVLGRYTDFFGAFWHNDNFGMGRYSLHDEKPGKKIWIWGLSDQGMIWEKLLTDTDGQYVEVQSGRLFNQAAEESSFTPFKNIGFAPSASDSWTEYWFPVTGTRGFVKANPHGAVNVRVASGFLKIYFSALQDINDQLSVFEGERVIYSKKINLRPLRAFSDSVAFQGNAQNLTVKLGEILHYETDLKKSDLSRPVATPADFNRNSTYGLYVQGKENIHRRFYPAAEQKLLACLSTDPNYLPALTEMAMLMYLKMDYDKSLSYAMHGLSIDTYSPAANYYYGLVNIKLGRVTDAKDGFDIAALSPEYRGAAYLQLSKLYCAEKDFTRALHYAMKSIESNTGNSEAWQMIALIARLTNNSNKAGEAIEKLRMLSPLNHFIRFEEYKHQPSEVTKNKFTSCIRNELPTETYLQLSEWYLSAGQLRESLAVLELAGPNPEVYYWIAFLKDKLKEQGSKEYIAKGNAMSPEMIFPFRSQSAEVLAWVLSQSDHWIPKYYLALIYWSRNDQERAKQLFNQCGSPDFAPFYASRALLSRTEDLEADLKKASQTDPSQWRYGRLLINHFFEKKNYQDALTKAQELHKNFPEDFRISMLLARSLIFNKKYKSGIDILSRVNVLPAEGSTDGRQLYREAWLMLAIEQLGSGNYKPVLNSLEMARSWPENLGAGKPYNEDIDSRLDNFLEAVYYEKTKQTKKATEKWNEVVSFKVPYNNLNTLVSALALRKTGRGEEGQTLLSDWVERTPENKLAKWCLDLYNGKEPTVAFEGNENYRVIMEFLAK
jgi:hypothetical protein